MPDLDLGKLSIFSRFIEIFDRTLNVFNYSIQLMLNAWGKIYSLKNCVVLSLYTQYNFVGTQRYKGFHFWHLRSLCNTELLKKDMQKHTYFCHGKIVPDTHPRSRSEWEK